MSEDELANGSAPAEGAEGAEEVDAAEEELLDEEASALLQDLEESQAEVQRMIQSQREQASELGGMKDNLAAELQELQDDAWKLQVFAELEMLKRQLAALNTLDADLDAMEAKLDEGGDEAVDEEFAKEFAAAQAGTRDMLAKMTLGAGAGSEQGDADASAASGGEVAGPTAGAEGHGEEDLEDVDKLQEDLDAELAAMQKQLQAIKAESALVAARKAQLELELMQLIRDGAEELTAQLQDLDVQQPEDQAVTEKAANTPA
ncbi:hypothetical protein GPECTOR_19g298 [Gonium pectorale]|uniref:Uncharacterized protein n=1 Tax=Gonium pectorale TaxID=33097 RepID=A0A150GJ65_GONPE|nr:hypothetical protein GPECTOR_19g298 [Gonium pectorale]|eukprot:KXZ49847.1 hypothetical protein GPECTOR_19g298 [Gonium pectorale]